MLARGASPADPSHHQTCLAGTLGLSQAQAWLRKPEARNGASLPGELARRAGGSNTERHLPDHGLVRLQAGPSLGLEHVEARSQAL